MKAWNWIWGKWSKLNPHGKWAIGIVVALVVYNWWIA